MKLCIQVPETLARTAYPDAYRVRPLWADLVQLLAAAEYYSPASMQIIQSPKAMNGTLSAQVTAP